MKSRVMMCVGAQYQHLLVRIQMFELLERTRVNLELLRAQHYNRMLLPVTDQQT